MTYCLVVIWQLRKMKLEIAELANNPMGLLMEAVHSAGYSGALANPLYAPESALDRLNGELLEEFMAVRPHQLLRIYVINVLICFLI